MDLPRDEHHAQQLHFTETMGLAFERWGMPPMAGRILGWLLICDPPQQSSAQLAAELGASKGSISTNTRTLIQAGFIRRTAVRGERGAYFEVDPEAWVEMLEAKLAALTSFRALFDQGLEVLKHAPEPQRRRLDDIAFVYRFFEGEWPKLMAQVHAARAARLTQAASSAPPVTQQEPPCAD